MAEKSVNEISRDVRQIFQKGNDALTRENYDYAVDLLTQVLEKGTFGFYEGRKAFAGGAATKSRRQQRIFQKSVEQREFNFPPVAKGHRFAPKSEPKH